MTADRPEVRPPRSSRTRGRSLQESTDVEDREPTCLTHVFPLLLEALDCNFTQLGWLTFSLYGHTHCISLGVAHVGFHRYKLTFRNIFRRYAAVLMSFCSLVGICVNFSSGSNGFNSRLLETATERFEPSSRIFLIGEQPNPWDLLQPQDKMSRHRGAEQRRRYGRLGATSLLSPE